VPPVKVVQVNVGEEKNSPCSFPAKTCHKPVFSQNLQLDQGTRAFSASVLQRYQNPLRSWSATLLVIVVDLSFCFSLPITIVFKTLRAPGLLM